MAFACLPLPKARLTPRSVGRMRGCLMTATLPARSESIRPAPEGGSICSDESRTRHPPRQDCGGPGRGAVPWPPVRLRRTRAMDEPRKKPSKARRQTVPDDATAAAHDAAWGADGPGGIGWTARPWVHPTDRGRAGSSARKRVPRTSHATFEPAAGRDPIAILAAQEADRLPDLVPMRHERMAESAFAYYRGTPAVMAFDLSSTPRSDILVQASGDAHISNFGLFASPERALVFDANDFDETLPGPWEWDVKRLAASVIDRRAGQRLRCVGRPRCDDGRGARLSRLDGALRRDAPDRCPVRLDHRRRHPGGGRVERRPHRPGRVGPPPEARGDLLEGAPT